MTASAAVVSCDVCQRPVALADTATLAGARVCYSCSLKPEARAKPGDTRIGRALSLAAGLLLVGLCLWWWLA